MSNFGKRHKIRLHVTVITKKYERRSIKNHKDNAFWNLKPTAQDMEILKKHIFYKQFIGLHMRVTQNSFDKADDVPSNTIKHKTTLKDVLCCLVKGDRKRGHIYLGLLLLTSSTAHTQSQNRQKYFLSAFTYSSG